MLLEISAGVLVLFIILIALNYSPSEYRKLVHLYREQVAADNAVYEQIAKWGVVRNTLFKLLNKNVGCYYE